MAESVFEAVKEGLSPSGKQLQMYGIEVNQARHGLLSLSR